MGGKIGVIICMLAAVTFYGTDHSVQFWGAIIVGIIVFWSYGIMHNYAMGSAKYRWDRIRENMIHEGRDKEEIERLDRTPIPITSRDANAAPDWLTVLNMVATLMGLILLVWGVAMRFF